MKKVIFVFLALLICSNGFALVCTSPLEEDRVNYWESNKDRQIGGEEFDKLDENGKREAKIRNLCFGASLTWHWFCSLKNCKHCDDNNLCTPVSMDDKISGLSIAEHCEYSKIDCFTDDIDKIFSVLKNSGDVFFNMAMPDMNDITSKILKGESVNTVIIDTDKSICYRTDDNGDTIWHAFARSNRDSYSFANLCVSVNDNPLDMLTNALYKIKNKKGRTALQDAIDSQNPDNLFKFLYWYAKQERKDYCDFLLPDILKYNSMDSNKLKSLLRCN